MKIKSISITNVKSFKNPTLIEFDTDFNIVIGPNASGKSNLLDIISICLRNFFLINYSFQNSGNGKNLITTAAFQNLPVVLDKYLGMDAPSEIEMTFVVKQEDLDNIKIYGEVKQQLSDYIATDLVNSSHHISPFQQINWAIPFLENGDLLSYKIINNTLEPVNMQNLPVQTDANYNTAAMHVKRFIFLKYLNYMQLLNMYQFLFPNKSIKPPFLFLSPYRGVGTDQDFKGNLSQRSSREIAQNFRSTTSKVMTSLINLATVYFSEKLRSMETAASAVGYKELWSGDPEVILVSKYLKRLGYGWNMHLQDQNKNIYEIRLEKQGHQLLLSQASSGEKEIINYLFGIFALKITNGLIIIDEPELHLHPRWQLLLLDLFLQLTTQTGNQFLITTHSPVFINVQSVSNLIRVYREDQQSKHVSLKRMASGSLKDLLHIVNSTNNEKIFFADIVILVEGITDRLVFQKIVSGLLTQNQVLSVVEVVEINGKGNIKKFRKYLKTLKIPYYFIADLDYVNQVGSEEVKQLFTTDLGAVDSNAIKNPKSSDGKRLVEILEEALANNDLKAVTSFLDYIKSFRRKLRDRLTSDEQAMLEFFIIARHSEMEYILVKGDIESYFPAGLSAKDLDNVIELLKEPQYSQWQKATEYQLLEQIVIDIFRDAKLIN